MRVVVVVAALLALSGCQAARTREAVSTAKQADTDCQSRSFKTAVALAECRNAAMRLAAPVAGDSMDLINVATAQRMVLAEKVDRKQISQSEADLEMAKTMSALNSTEQGRERAQRQDRGTSCTTRRQFNTLVTDCN
jgi:limonene-1,2-epoxide hydrolase